MDCDDLIAAVIARPSLWDQKNKNYHNRDISRILWIAVATEMNCTPEAAKNKWRGLRDTFRKEVQKELKSRSENADGKARISTWKHYDDMKFIRDQFTIKKLTTSNISAAESDSNNGLETDCDNEIAMISGIKSEENDEPMSLSIEPTSITTLVNPQDILASNTANRLKIKAYRKLLALKEKKRFKESQKQREETVSVSGNARIIEDSDYHFLISLLPYLRRVSSERKMMIRTQIQQVFCREEERIARREVTNQYEDAFVEPSSLRSYLTNQLSPSSRSTSPPSSHDAYNLRIVTE